MAPPAAPASFVLATIPEEVMTAPALSTRDLRRVVIAAAVGNVIEWYDFYIFGSLAAILSVQFFSKSDPVAAFLSTVALFSVGFLIRPLGAFVFGRVGDLVGRKYTFLVTLSGMGLSTALIGVIPSYASIGLSAAFILFFLRLIQGLCLGGEYGGAITYVAEHVPDAKRGYYTGWLQTSPTLGIVLSLAVIIGTREIVGPDAWNAWGWRIPFLLSLLMVAIALYIRLRLQETPIFQAIKARGQTATNPWREAFLSQNLKFVIIASVVVMGEGVVWYSGQFWALYFLQQIRKPDVLTPSDHRRGRAAHRHPDVHFVRVALRQDRPQADHSERVPARGAHLLSALHCPRAGRGPGQHELSRRDFDRRHHGLIRRDGLWPDRRVPRGVLPGPHPVHVGVRALSHRERVGWRAGADHHDVRLPVHHSLGSALIYPIAVPAVCFLVSLFLMPETRANRIGD